MKDEVLAGWANQGPGWCGAISYVCLAVQKIRCGLQLRRACHAGPLSPDTFPPPGPLLIWPGVKPPKKVTPVLRPAGEVQLALMVLMARR